jgi:hypothetical protein
VKKVILHIGPHKTGSSYLQKALCDNEELLKSKDVVYPKEWRDFLWGHHSLVTEIISSHNEASTNKFKNKLKTLLDEYFKNYSIVVFSSENFENLSAEQLKVLRCVQENFELEVVYYIRKGSSLAFSSWQEEIKHGSSEKFESFLFKHLSKPFQSRLFNYNTVLDRFTSTLNVKPEIIIYDNLIEEAEDIAKHFLSKILSIKTSNILGGGQKINESLNVLEVEIIRGLNFLAKEAKESPNDVLRNKFLRLKYQLEKEVAIMEEYVPSSLKSIELDDSGFIFSSLYEQTYNKWSESIINLPEGNAKLFKTLHSKSIEYINEDIWLNREALNALKIIFDKVSR